MKSTLLKFAIVFAVCSAVHILVSLFSSLIVNKFILNTRLANFTMYDGYANFSVLLTYFLLSALLVFDKIKGNVLVITMSSFFAFIIFKAFVIDVAEHYLRFYVKTEQNWDYSFEIFKNQLGKQWNNILWEFGNLGQFLSFLVWIFIGLLGVCYLSLWVKNIVKKRELV